jgi:hypothetical protein
MHSCASSQLFHGTATAYFKYKWAKHGLHANTLKYLVYWLKQILAKPLSFSLTENSSSHVFITQLLPTDHWQGIIRNGKKRWNRVGRNKRRRKEDCVRDIWSLHKLGLRRGLINLPFLLLQW